MSTGKSEVPCNDYRAWKGQEPLCGNCAWFEKEHKDVKCFRCDFLCKGRSELTQHLAETHSIMI